MQLNRDKKFKASMFKPFDENKVVLNTIIDSGMSAAQAESVSKAIYKNWRSFSKNWNMVCNAWSDNPEEFALWAFANGMNSTKMKVRKKYERAPLSPRNSRVMKKSDRAEYLASPKRVNRLRELYYRYKGHICDEWLDNPHAFTRWFDALESKSVSIFKNDDSLPLGPDNFKLEIRKRAESWNEIKGISRSRHPLYKSWYQMIERCYNKSNKQYRMFGERGIKVHPDWLNLDNYVAYFEANGWTTGADLYLTRIDKNKDFEPSNVKLLPRMAFYKSFKRSGITKDKLTDEFKAKLRINVEKARSSKKVFYNPILCVETNTVYDNWPAATRATGIRNLRDKARINANNVVQGKTYITLKEYNYGK